MLNKISRFALPLVFCGLLSVMVSTVKAEVGCCVMIGTETCIKEATSELCSDLSFTLTEDGICDIGDLNTSDEIVQRKQKAFVDACALSGRYEHVRD